MNQPTAPTIRVIIVDEQTVSRENLALALEKQRDIYIVGMFHNGEQAILQMQKEAKIDVILLSMQINATKSIKSIYKIKQMFSACKIIVLSPTDRYASLSRKAGAMGYILTTRSNMDGVIAGIRAVYRDIFHFEVIPLFDNVLTETETRVLELIGESLSNTEIAEQLNYSTRSVGFYVTKILRKLNAIGREQAVKIAMQQGIIH